MNDLVLVVDNLSKKYCRNLKKSLRYGVIDIAKELMARSGDEFKLRPDEFWALQDVSFKLKRGESLGLIGRNGAGKTTLLKLINGLIKPTSGKITIHGTIGALIALGTGFNPILTGRENIMIAGAVLGFSKREMNEKLEEIIDFAEMREFIDTPVRSYSSGMLVRLGFSVAIQMKPDLLLVDEVLAVGDLSFAIKCMKKITEYRNKGGSIVLVSHGMHNVRFHCDRAILFEKSMKIKEGSSGEVCDEYEHRTAYNSSGDGTSLIYDKKILIGDVRMTKSISSGDPFVFEIDFISDRVIEKPVIVFSIYDIKNQHLTSNYSTIDNHYAPFKIGKNTIHIEFKTMPLANGVYRINFVMSEDEVNNHLLVLQGQHRFEVKNSYSTLGILSLKPKWFTKNG